ncbi:MAG TPA: hypothetical protein VM925_32455 [Labilithrix sp.]|nr:hypothetical protein [Labilithrix sp.]
MRRRALLASLSIGLAACTSLLGDFTVDSTPGPTEQDATTADVLAESSVPPDDAGADAPNDAETDEAAPVPIAVATNSIATCATVAYFRGTPKEKQISLCWGAGNDSPAFLGAAQGDPQVNGFMRPRLPNTNPPAYLTFDAISGNARGLAFMGRIAAGEPQGAATAYCWGSNTQAECGLATNGMVPPTALAPSSGGLRVANGALAPYHGCVISQGRLYCWGQNNWCEVRSGSTSSCNSADPQNPFVRFVEDQSAGVIGGGGASSQPAYEFDRFAGGYDHSCVVYRKAGATTAVVECWGKNESGQTGQPAGPASFIASPTEVVGTDTSAGFGNLELASGATHSCAIVTKNNLRCWGKNDKGQAGPGKPTPAAPATVELPPALTGTLTGLALGGDVSCVVTTAGVGAPRAVCFGDKNGPRGRAPADADKDFGLVDGVKDVIQIAVGGDHACAIARGLAQLPTAPHSLFCWGKNDQKQVDPSSPIQAFPTPHRVVFPSSAP